MKRLNMKFSEKETVFKLYNLNKEKVYFWNTLILDDFGVILVDIIILDFQLNFLELRTGQKTEYWFFIKSNVI